MYLTSSGYRVRPTKRQDLTTITCLQGNFEEAAGLREKGSLIGIRRGKVLRLESVGTAELDDRRSGELPLARRNVYVLISSDHQYLCLDRDDGNPQKFRETCDGFRND